MPRLLAQHHPKGEHEGRQSREAIIGTLRITPAHFETWRSPAENGGLWWRHVDFLRENGDFGDKTGVFWAMKASRVAEVGPVRQENQGAIFQQRGA